MNVCGNLMLNKLVGVTLRPYDLEDFYFYLLKAEGKLSGN
jgi:hypothetical protein